MDWGPQLGAVTLVLGLLLGSLWLLRRRGLAGLAPAAKSPGKRLRRMERLALGPHHALDLVRVGERTILVAASPGGCSLLDACARRNIAVFEALELDYILIGASGCP